MRVRSHLMMLLAGFTALTASAPASVMYFAGDGEETVEIIGAFGTEGTITSPNGFTTSFKIGASRIATVTIPAGTMAPGTITNNGYVLKTKNPFAIVGVRQGLMTLMDSHALGTSYIASSYSGAQLHREAVAGSQLYLVGTQDSTSVTITPNKGIYPGQATFSGPSSREPFTITLNKGQSVVYESIDVTGAAIKSSAPLAVYAGSKCATPAGGVATGGHPACAGGPVLAPMPSTDKFTRTAVVPTAYYATGSDIIGDRVRVVAKTDNTVVKWNGTTVATLAKGGFAEFDSGNGGVVNASKPVMVTKITKFKTENDPPLSGSNWGTMWSPGLTWVPGTDQWRNHYVFEFPDVDLQPPEYQDYLDIAIPTSALWSLRLNGHRVSRDDCQSIGSGRYSTCEILVGEGIGEIWASQPFLALMADYSQHLTYAGADFLPQPWLRPYLFAAEDSVPEPATPLLALAGFGLLWTLRRRRS
jgi:uncharacterized protein (TIGR03382 family)